MPVTPDSELEAFKTDIDLRASAALLGYELDRKVKLAWLVCDAQRSRRKGWAAKWSLEKI